MSYIELINRYWQEDSRENFSGNQTRLYFLLLDLANRSIWPETITCSDRLVSARAGISFNAMKRARLVLKERGLIGFEAGGKGHANKTRYQILTPKLIPSQIPNRTPTPLYNKTKNKDYNYESKNRKSAKGFVTSSGDFNDPAE